MTKCNVLTAACLATLLSTVSAGATQEDPANFDTGMITSPHILLPTGDVSSVVVLISDAAGWGANENSEAEQLANDGTIVIGIDFPSYIASLKKDDGDCVYMVSDIEALSQQVQRKAANSHFRHPIVAGIGEGGALALAIAAQSPPATIGETLAVDPRGGIPLTKQLCTPATKVTIGDRMIYGLTDGPLPDPITVIFTKNAMVDGRDHVAELKKMHPDIDVSDTPGDARSALSQALSTHIAAKLAKQTPLDLPINILPAQPALNTMAVIYSGDGGWRDIDKQVGMSLQAQGIPVVGIDSLRYFWSARQPSETADDLAKIIAFYRKEWNVEHVILIGYSFGADVLPATYNRLSETDKARIPQMTLLALSHQVDYEVSVLGWLGAAESEGAGDPVNDLKSIDSKIVQCIYGTDEDEGEDACSGLKASGAEIIPIDGGHHFDGDYVELAGRIIDGLKRRL
jgi:type IV secretory pathway VirJ component